MNFRLDSRYRDGWYHDGGYSYRRNHRASTTATPALLRLTLLYLYPTTEPPIIQLAAEGNVPPAPKRGACVFCNRECIQGDVVKKSCWRQDRFDKGTRQTLLLGAVKLILPESNDAEHVVDHFVAQRFLPSRYEVFDLARGHVHSHEETDEARRVLRRLHLVGRSLPDNLAIVVIQLLRGEGLHRIEDPTVRRFEVLDWNFFESHGEEVRKLVRH